MSRIPFSILILLLATLMVPAVSWAQANHPGSFREKPTTDDGRYNRKEEGWFWYKQDPEPPEPVPEEKPKERPAEPSPDKPKPFSSQWVREKLDEYRLVAIDDPNQENIETYLLLQKLAMDKAEQFALAHRTYALMNPGIDETVQNPTGGTSRVSMNDAQERAMKETIEKIGQQAGLWYFYASDCQFCHKQNMVVDIMQRTSGIDILPIALDGRSSPDGFLQNWRPDRGQAAMLGVTGTPTFYIVHPDTNKVVMLASGVRTMPDMQQRIIEVARAHDWITQEEYDLAMRGLPRKFLTEGLPKFAEEMNVDEDPAALLAVLREATTHGSIVESSLDEVDASTVTPWQPKNNRTNRQQ